MNPPFARAIDCDAHVSVPSVRVLLPYLDEVVMSVEHGPTAISPVALALADAGVHVEGLTLRTPTLDDVFLELTGGHLADNEELSLEEEYA